MRIFRSTKDARMWVSEPTEEKGKMNSQRVTLENEISEDLWVATKNRYIDYTDIEPPLQEDMELIEEEITVAEEVLDKNGKLVFPARKRMVQTLRISNRPTV